MVLAVDEVVCAGSVELLEPQKILNMLSLKWEKRDKREEGGGVKEGGSVYSSQRKLTVQVEGVKPGGH